MGTPKSANPSDLWVVVRLDIDVFYWNDARAEWVLEVFHASKYPARIEAEGKLLWLTAKTPTLIGNVAVKNLNENGFATSQGQLF